MVIIRTEDCFFGEFFLYFSVFLVIILHLAYGEF